MIRYDLKCTKGHAFDSWFASSAAYDTLRSAGHVACPRCNCKDISKALMAPAVTQTRKGVTAAPTPSAPDGDGAAVAGSASPAQPSAERPLTAPPQDPQAAAHAAALAALRQELEKRSEYVGLSFAAEARKIHSGETPERAIHGEAPLEEARQLIEEGIPVAALPFMPRRQTN